MKTRNSKPETRNERFLIRSGSLADYRPLAHLHYRPTSPAVATRVLVLEPDPASRRTQAASRHAPLAVLVETMPTLSSRLRDRATGSRYHGNPGLLNRDIRRITRLVVHPMYQGMGLAVALIRHALNTATTPLTEALALSGWQRSYFQHAGMAALFPDRADQPVYYIHDNSELKGSGFGVQAGVPRSEFRVDCRGEAR